MHLRLQHWATLNTTAFSSEIYRAGIQSIERSQWEAAKALGMSYLEQMRRVIMPQAVKRMIPAFMNRAVELMKMTSLASVIAYGELMHQAKTISTIAFNPIEMYTSVAFMFLQVFRWQCSYSVLKKYGCKGLKPNARSSKIENLHKSFDKLEVLAGIDLTLNKGETVVLVGASGSGNQPC